MFKICLIKLGAKGDVVRTIPVLSSIKEKYPDSEIHWITKPQSYELLKNISFLTSIIPLPVSLSEIPKFDILFNFDIESEATDLAEKIPANKKFGFYSEGGYLSSFNLSAEYYLNTLFDDELKKTNTRTYQEMMFDLAELDYKKQHSPLTLPKNVLAYAEEFLRLNSLQNKRIIGIHIGASARWPSKAWHMEKIIELVLQLRNKEYEIILLAGPDEKNKQEQLELSLKTKGIGIFKNNPANTDVEFCAIINFCEKIVCGDSFALHIALALKKPTVGLFFCTTPHEVEDYGLLKKVVSPKILDFFPEKQNLYDEDLVKSIPAGKVLHALESFDTYKKAVNAIIKKGDKILIIKRASGLYSGKWAFPGGIVEKTETIGEALEREIFEEVNLRLKKITKKVSAYQYLWEDGTPVEGECYLAEVYEGNSKLNNEIQEAKWVSAEELSGLDCIPGLEDEAFFAFSDFENK